MPRWISTAQRTASTTLANQHAVAGCFDDPAVMLDDLRIDQFATMGLELAERAFLVCFHQSAVAGDVRCENRSEPAFDSVFDHYRSRRKDPVFLQSVPVVVRRTKSGL
jgi:hypothetical protein